MNDTELVHLIAAAASVSDAEVERWDLAGPEADLRERIMSTTTAPATSRPAGAGPGEPGEVVPFDPPPRRPRRRRTVAVGVAAATALAIAAGATLATRDGAGKDSVSASDQTPDQNPAPAGPSGTIPPAAPEDIAAAEGVPHLASRADGWHIVWVDPGDGYERLSDDTSKLDVHWAAGFDDGPPDVEGVETTVAGEPAVRYRIGPHDCEMNDSCQYDGGQTPGPADIGFEYMTLLTVGDNEVRITGHFRDDDTIDAALAGLVTVPATEWLALLPADTVLPSERAATVDEMLTGLPLPPGFDPAPLRSADTISNRYQVGAQVTGSVACPWFDSWAAGLASGDTAAVQAAVDAMASAPQWPILTEMADQGGWSHVVWDLAAAMPTNSATISGGLQRTVSETYRENLGCGRFD
ncbi:MAG TPA: hypothetical protein VH479_08775 [Acidimicrobiales bacterium]|jgi:hypothetical protein